MPEFPIRDVFAPVGWIFVVLLAANVALLVTLLVLREQWALIGRRRERIAARLEPLIERVVGGADPERTIDELRPVIAELGYEDRPVAAWLVRDLSRDADGATRARIQTILAESGAVAVAERSTRRWMPWRRALACEFLGSFGAASSVPVLVERLGDRRSEVRSAAARALGALGFPAATAALEPLFLRRGAVPTGVAYDALRNLGPAAAATFRRGLRAADPVVRVASCFGVAAEPGEGGPESAIGPLAELLRGDADPRVRAAAAKALRAIGGTVPPSALVEAAHDDEPRVRREAVAALGRFDDPDSVPALAALTRDSDREVALRAAESLLALRRLPEAGGAARAAVERSTAWSLDYTRTIAELAS